MQAYLELDALAAALGEAPQLSEVLLTIDPRQRDRLMATLAEVPGVVQVIEVSSFRDAFAAQSGDSMTFFTWLVVSLGVVIAVGVVYNNARVALSERPSHQLALDRALAAALSERIRPVSIPMVVMTTSSGNAAACNSASARTSRASRSCR